MSSAKSAPYKRRLTNTVLGTKPHDRAFLIWDEMERGLALRVEPTGYKSFKFIYSRAGRTRWYNIGAIDEIKLKDARTRAAELRAMVGNGKDPQAERVAERTDGTFQQLAEKYLEHAKRKNRSWQQAHRLVERFLRPQWGKLRAAEIRRSDVRLLMAKIEAPIVANQTLAAASAIFAWGFREELIASNPCQGVDRNPTASRERVLSDDELFRFWSALDGQEIDAIAAAALRVLLLTGQRPGEVAHMRAEHVDAEGWWNMPRDPDPEVGWPGVKNKQDHRVWLARPAIKIVRSLTAEGERGFVFAGQRGGPPNLTGTMREICRLIDIPRATPHDLRRTFGTRMAEQGFGDDYIDRVLNHVRKTKVQRTYNRHKYDEENRRATEATAARILTLCGQGEASNVVQFAAQP